MAQMFMNFLQLSLSVYQTILVMFIGMPPILIIPVQTILSRPGIPTVQAITMRVGKAKVKDKEIIPIGHYWMVTIPFVSVCQQEKMIAFQSGIPISLLQSTSHLLGIMKQFIQPQETVQVSIMR